MSSGTVLVVATDERWLRVLEVTLRLGGYTPVARRSMLDALKLRVGDEQPRAVVLDLGVDSVAADVDAVTELLTEIGLRAIVILPDRFADQAAQFRASGAHVIVRPYPPSALYAALEAGIARTGQGGSAAASSADPSDADPA